MLCIGCKEEVNYSNDYIYTNDFLSSHYYSKDIKIEFVLSEDETLMIDDYCCNQVYIDMLCHYIKLEEVSTNVLDEIKTKPYLHLSSTNSDNLKVEAYITKSGKIIIISDNKYYASADDVTDFNKCNETVELKELIKYAIPGMIRWSFKYSYDYSENHNVSWSIVDHNRNKKETFVNKEEYEYYRYTQYLNEYLSNVDIKLIKVINKYYDDGIESKAIVTNKREEMRKDMKEPGKGYVQISPLFNTDYVSDSLIGIIDYTSDTMIINLFDNTSYYIYTDLSEVYESLMRIYNYEIEELNALIDAEWIEYCENNANL